MSLRAAFLSQARGCAALGSPFMARLCTLFAERLQPGSAVAGRLLAWEGDVSSNGQSVPLRIAGALHALVLDGSDPELAAAYPPNAVPDDALWDAIQGACRRHVGRIMAWLDSAPQTNEVRRAVAMLTAGAMLRDRTGLPLAVSELGASAGLNLSFDRFGADSPEGVLGASGSDVLLRPDWTGVAPKPSPVEIVDAAGVDLNPIDPGSEAGALRLLAYLWPDQPDRIARTRAAIALAGAMPDAGDAADWLERRLEHRFPGAVHMVYHTIAWQYFPDAVQARCWDALAAAGANATAEAPLARMSMEADETSGGAGLSLTLWDGGPGSGETVTLGRIDFHGRWIKLDRAEI